MQAIDPRFRQTIPISAGRLMPFTPRSLDIERIKRETEDDIAREQTQIDSVIADAPGEVVELPARQAVINARRANLATALNELRGKVPTRPVFMLRIPTPIERDQINSRLVSLGLVAISQEQIRASMIEALFEHDWGKGSKEANETEAEELAAFMDGVWQREEAHNRAIAEWQQQEVERVLDQFNGAPARPRADLPPRIITPRESAKTVLLIDDMQKTPRMRAIAARQWDFERQNAMILVRMALVAVQGLSTAPITVDPADNALPEQEVLAVRDAMEGAYGPVLANQAWDEIVRHIDSSYTLDGFEEKNSDSPPEKPSDLTGSIGRSGDTETSGGSSTASSSGPAPAGASETTTGKSSGSTTDAKAASSTGSDSPTDEA